MICKAEGSTLSRTARVPGAAVRSLRVCGSVNRKQKVASFEQQFIDNIRLVLDCYARVSNVSTLRVEAVAVNIFTVQIERGRIKSRKTVTMFFAHSQVRKIGLAAATRRHV